MSVRVSPVRLLLLVALFAAANSWLGFHLGYELAGVSLVTGFMALAGLAVQALRKREQAELKERIRAALVAVTEPSFLASCALALAVVGSLVSSVRVLDSGAGESLSVQLTAEGSQPSEDSRRELAAEGSEQFVRWVWPFGRAFSLEVDGYQRHSFDLYPWVGATLRVARDLERSPTLLLRVPEDKFPLLEGGRMRFRVGDGEPVDVPLQGGSASVMIGREMTIPAAMIQDWRSELLAKGLEGPVAEERIRSWRNAVQTGGGPGLRPDDRAHAEFVARSGASVAGAEFTVDEAALQDVYLEKKPPAAPPEPSP